MTQEASQTPAGKAPQKGHRDENFPVASFILRPEHRAAVMAFYRFARKADDVADDADLKPDEKLARLALMRDALEGAQGVDPEAEALRAVSEGRGLASTHGLELLEAFRRDATTSRCQNLGELMDYCRYSAMPVGRFVLDVHNESSALWPASDALCAALQLINHLQDSGKDYRDLGRVYLPLDILVSENCDVEALGGTAAPPELLRTVRRVGRTVQDLLERARPFAAGIKDARLGYEVAVIQKLAEELSKTLMRRDPLSQRVKHRPAEAAALAVLGAAGGFFQRRRVRR